MPPSSQSKSQFKYRGHDILQLLKEARNYNRWLTDMVVSAAPPLADRILDLGAGCGTFSSLVRERGTTVECVEPDTANAKILRDLGFVVYNGLSCIEPNSIEFIFSFNVLEHVVEDQALIEEAFNCLRPNGTFLIFVPAFPVLWSSLDDHVEHQRRYRRKPLVAMVQKVGFKVESARYADSVGFFAALAFGSNPEAKLSPRKIALYDRGLFPFSVMLDRIVRGTFGKNLTLLCRKP